MLWYLSGETHIRNLRKHTKIWDAWTSEDQNWEIGKMYGYQWVKWEKFKEKEDGSIEKTYINQIKEVINLIKGGLFSNGDKEKFQPLVDNLLNHDPFCVCADFSDYCDAQDRVSSAWKDWKNWQRMSLMNVARSGFFSSDRSIRDYCNTIWNI